MALLASAVSVVAMASASTYLVPEGESRVYRLQRPITRVAVGNPDVADFMIFNHTDLYLLGKKPGATNLIIWDQKGNVTTASLHVSRNIKPIKVLLKAALPNERNIDIYSLGPALVLAGTVSDALAAETAYRLVKAYLGGTVPGVNPESTLANSASASGSVAPATISGVANSGSLLLPLPLAVRYLPACLAWSTSSKSSTRSKSASKSILLKCPSPTSKRWALICRQASDGHKAAS